MLVNARCTHNMYNARCAGNTMCTSSVNLWKLPNTRWSLVIIGRVCVRACVYVHACADLVFVYMALCIAMFAHVSLCMCRCACIQFMFTVKLLCGHNEATICKQCNNIYLGVLFPVIALGVFTQNISNWFHFAITFVRLFWVFTFSVSSCAPD